MTTPPDTPKPPAELWLRKEGAIEWHEVGSWQDGTHRYILAPSPQESHKLAEELERLIDDGASCSADKLHEAIYRIGMWTIDKANEIRDALRSSPSEQTSELREEFERMVLGEQYATKLGQWVRANGQKLIALMHHAPELDAAKLLRIERQVRLARRFHFAHNPPNTGLAQSFNDILVAIGAPDAPEGDTARIAAIDAAIAASGGAKGDGNG